MNRSLFAFLTANVASGRPVPPSQALGLDGSLARLVDQNRALQEQLAIDREVMARALKQQERDQTVQASLIREAQRQAARANLLATTLDDLIRTFTDADPSASRWSGKRFRSLYVREQQLDDWRALLPASESRRAWRTDLISRGEHNRKVQEAQDTADYARKRTDHLLSVEQQHSAELKLRASAEHQLREVTAERDELRREIATAKVEAQRLAEALASANSRSTTHWGAQNAYHRRWRGTVTEARRQAARADAAEALAEAQVSAVAVHRTQIADLTRTLADVQRSAARTSVPLADYLNQARKRHRQIAALEEELRVAHSQLAVAPPMDQSGQLTQDRVHPTTASQVSAPLTMEQPAAIRDGLVQYPRVQVTYQAELVAQVDVWGRRRVGWTDSGQQTPGYVRVGSLPDHATVTVLGSGQ